LRSYSDEITPLTNSENNIGDKTSQEKLVSEEIKFLGIEKVKNNAPEKAQAMKYSNLMSNKPNWLYSSVRWRISNC